MLRAATCLLLGLLGGACSGAAPGAASSSGTPSFDESAVLQLQSTSNALSVEVRTWPSQPPTLGNNSVQLTVTDDSGAPAAGLSLDVLPWMPAMGHGTSKSPVTAETSPGVYQIDNVYLFMPGTWQIRTTFSGAVDDQVVPTFQVQ